MANPLERVRQNSRLGWVRQAGAIPGVPIRRASLVLAALILLLGITSAQEAKPKPQPQQLPWAKSLVEGYGNALRKQEPILVRVGATWCGWCKKLDEEIAKPRVQAELRRWTLVYLDLDKSPQEAKTLGVGPVPALRVLTATGKQVAAQDGYLTEEKLLAWLKEKYEATEETPPEILVSKKPPSESDLVKLIEMFSKRDPALREAAARRMQPHPEEAAKEVVKAFTKGSLQVRLATLELLLAWNAPAKELDPWRPETITPERLAQLAEWAKSPKKPVAAAPNKAAEEMQARKAEIARMLKAGTPAEAAAIREQLARHGAALLPVVYEQLKNVQGDQERERLTALRYRLVASERLALQWPVGLEQLAATQTPLRHQAAQELARRATADDEALLLELFSDPDPLVREISLRALHGVTGDRATEALTRLLGDPDPNVKAAVLKQLEERPSLRLLSTINDFTSKEKDPDLLVHAIRVLRTLKHKESVDCLKKLLAHENWRVRAESADILYGYVKDRYGANRLDGRTSADVQEIFLKLLSDPDGFVVSRGVKGLQMQMVDRAVDPLAKVLEKHPDLAKDVIDSLRQNHQAREKVLGHLRRFCSSPHTEVRAEAIGGLCLMEGASAQKELLAALKDEAPDVRRAGASALYDILQAQNNSPLQFASSRWQQQSRSGFSPPPVPVMPPHRGQRVPSRQQFQLVQHTQVPTPYQQDGRLYDDAMNQHRTRSRSAIPYPYALPLRTWAVTQQGMIPLLTQIASWEKEEALLRKEGADYDRVAENFLAGKGRQQWISDCLPLLRPMLQAKTGEERLAAALCLVALGDEKQALPVLLDVARAEPTQMERAARVFGWLPWERRLVVFKQMLAFNPEPEEWRDVVIAFASTNDFRTIPYLWNMTAQPDLKPENGNSLLIALLQAHFGMRYLYEGMQTPTRFRQAAEQVALQRSLAGPELQRLIGLSLLAILQPPEAQRLAELFIADPKTPSALRLDAWQITLFTQGEHKAQQLAARELTESDSDPQIKAKALRILAFGVGDAGSLRGGKFNLGEVSYRSYTGLSARNAEPQLPRGLHSYHVKPFLTDNEKRTAAAAAYLLTMMGEKDALEPLLQYWSTKASTDEKVMRMVYRAIVKVGDDSLVPVLETIYRRLVMEHPESLHDMLSQVQNMNSPAARRLSKRIRFDLQLIESQSGEPGVPYGIPSQAPRAPSGDIAPPPLPPAPR